MTSDVKGECRICKKPSYIGNAYYCVKCREVLKGKGAYRYKIGNDVFVWVKGGQVRRAVYKGDNVEPIRQCYEVVE